MGVIGQQASRPPHPPSNSLISLEKPPLATLHGLRAEAAPGAALKQLRCAQVPEGASSFTVLKPASGSTCHSS